MVPRKPQWDRATEALGEDMMEHVWENDTATFDEEVYMEWLKTVNSLGLDLQAFSVMILIV